MNLIDEQRPLFVRICGDTFSVNGKNHSTIQVMIQKLQPIRKLFHNATLQCYSMDAKISSSKNTYCVFCDQRYRCQRKLRLSMMMIDQGEILPIILDVNEPSFQHLQRLTDDIGIAQLSNTTVSIKIVYDNSNRKTIEFSQ
jgi:hypothetical protein